MGERDCPTMQGFVASLKSIIVDVQRSQSWHGILDGRKQACALVEPLRTPLGRGMDVVLVVLEDPLLRLGTQEGSASAEASKKRTMARTPPTSCSRQENPASGATVLRP